MTTYPWDTVPHYSPDWKEIEGKAQFYKTAYRRSDGRCVALLGVSQASIEASNPLFVVRDGANISRMTTEQLCGFCL